MELNEAYRIMELPEGSPMEEVEKRYELLLKKTRSSADMSEFNKAYRMIKDTEFQSVVAKKNEARYGSGKFGRFREKTDYFWEYYRWHVIGIIAAVILVISVVNTVVHQSRQNAVKPDLSVMIFGNYEHADTQNMQKNILQLHPKWKRVKFTLTYVPAKIRSQYDTAMLQKSVVSLMTEKPDVLIVDRLNYQKLLKEGGFVNLDAFAAKLKGDANLKTVTGIIPKDSGTTETSDGKSHIYGIDLTGNPFWTAYQMPAAGEKIAVISISAKHEANGEQFIEELLNGKDQLGAKN